MNSSLKASPNKISNDIFNSYYSCYIEQQEKSKSTGIVIDDGLFEIKFLKEKDVQIAVNGQRIAIPHICILGKVGVPSKLIIPHQMTYFTIKIQPWMASFFLEEEYGPINELSSTKYPNIDQLHTKLFASKNFEEQVEQVEDYFLKRALPNLQEFEISKKISKYIYKHHGDIKVKELVALFPHSRQKLNRIFLAQTKNSIKEFSVLTRLRAIMSYHLNHPEKSLTTIAYDFGYFDQSHFIKDMKKVSGVTPSEFSNTSNFFYEQIKKNTT